MTLSTADLLSTEGAIARRLDGFESRPQQSKMADAVEQAFEDKAQLLVEAGTGVGKSFAYLIPAIRRIVEHNERVVVATNTINLQEQLIDKDIPLLNAVIPDEFSAVLVKGRGNYMSLRRLKLASERQEALFGDEESRRSLHAIEDWAYQTQDGSLATLPQISRTDVWDYVRSDSHNCMGRRCETYEKCFYQRARRRMENGDLLVCNHALFFADLSLRSRGVGFLPPYDHVILDEAHRAEDVAAEHFGLSLTEGQAHHLLRLLYSHRTGKGFLPTLKLKDNTTEAVDAAIHQVLRCVDFANGLFDDLHRWCERDGPENGRIHQKAIIDNAFSDAMRDLSKRLKFLRERAEREADEFELNSYAQRVGDIAEETQYLIDQEIDGCVYWVESTARRGARSTATRRRISLHCMPIEVAPILEEKLFDQDIGVVLTSATLATGQDNFAHVTERLGCDGARTMQLGSPFHHADQMQVFVDRTMPDPNDSKYVDALIPRIEKHIRDTDGGAFVLFTSFAMLDRTAQKMRPSLTEAGYTVLAQRTDGPPGLLVKRFRDGRRAVLFGTSSFWQGVDVRGDALRNVIITRLPFEVPDRPLIQARHERISERGGNPFVEDQIPNAIIRFKQGVGRLIRSSTDEGRVVILDPRIATKPYGRLFMESLPDNVPITADAAE